MTLTDKPTVGVVVVVLAAVTLFAPTIIGHLRRIHAFGSISALNALAFLLVVCILASPWFLSGALAVWGVTVIWSLRGRRLDA
jgi:hypothetical protein